MIGLALAGCGGDATDPQRAVQAAGAEGATAGSGWIMPPAVQAVAVQGAELVVSGLADPGGRVVLRTPAGRAYAAVADAEGAFEVRLAAVDGLVLTPEAQLGQDAVPAPERLVVLEAARGTAVLLSPGGTSRRLGERPLLASVDQDGRAMILAGWARPDTEVRLEVPGRGPMPVRTDAAGHWRVGMDGMPPSEVRVNGQVFAIPGPSVAVGDAAASVIVLAAREEGFLLRWQAPDGAPQTSWLPRR